MAKKHESPDPSPGEATYAERAGVAPQITDAVTSAGLTVLGEAPAMAMAQIYQSLAQTTGLMFQNAVTAQQNMNVTSQAATVQGIMQLYGLAAPPPAPSSEHSQASHQHLGDLVAQLAAVVADLRRDA